VKIALASDLHGQAATLFYLEYILDCEKPDAIILSGDLSSENLEFFRKLEDELKKYPQAFLIGGNADQSISKEIEDSGFSINEKCKRFKDIKLCGLSYPEESTKVSSDLEGAVFVTHRPPVKALMTKQHSGSPRYHISGHLHKLAYRKDYPSVSHIQVPTLQEGRYGLLDTDKDTVEFKTAKLI